MAFLFSCLLTKLDSVPEATMKGSLDSPPYRFLCPLTLQIFYDPVLSKYGHVYERSAILEWLENHEHCPMTRQTLSPRYLISHTPLRREIQHWKMSTAGDMKAECGIPCFPDEAPR
jgi:hypothetical protein